MRKISAAILIIFLTSTILTAKTQARIKDISYLKGVRENQLRGYGIVIGLNGKGDSSSNPITKATMQNLMDGIGISLGDAKFQTKNLAVVMVTVDIPPSVNEGDKIGVTVSSIGDAKSLQGGVLLQTALKGADDVIYAVAQGSTIIADLKMPTTAFVPSGAIVEKNITAEYLDGNKFTLILNNGDFQTVQNISAAIREKFEDITIANNDFKNITLTIPEEYKDRQTEFIALVQETEVETDTVAKVVINEKAGVVVIGEDVRVSSVGVSVAGIKVQVDRDTGNKKNANNVIENSATVKALVDNLDDLGVDIKEIIQILLALKRAGALQADIVLE